MLSLFLSFSLSLRMSPRSIECFTRRRFNFGGERDTCSCKYMASFNTTNEWSSRGINYIEVWRRFLRFVFV